MKKIKAKIFEKLKKARLKKYIVIFNLVLLVFVFNKYFDKDSNKYLDYFNQVLDFFGVEKIEPKSAKQNFNNYDLIINIIDVGHGDSILIEFKNKNFKNKNIDDFDYRFALIDTGSAKQSEKLLSCLKKHHVKKLDFIVISHSHSDHMGALGEVLQSKSIKAVDQILVPNYFGVKDKIINYNKINKLIKEKNIKIKNAKPGQKIKLGQASFEILHPIVEKKMKLPKDINDSSIVGILRYNEFKMMFTGDATKFLENKLVNNFAEDVLKCSVLKLAHHGSETSSSLSFLKAVQPEFAVVSSGDEKDIIYPHQKVRENLKKLDINYYNTRLYGDIIIGVSEKGDVNLISENK